MVIRQTKSVRRRGEVKEKHSVRTIADRENFAAGQLLPLCLPGRYWGKLSAVPWIGPAAPHVLARTAFEESLTSGRDCPWKISAEGDT